MKILNHKGVSLINKVEDILQHHGVKGMKWGIRRYQPYPKGEGHKGKFIKKVGKKISDSRVGQEVRSASRELRTIATKRNMDNMSTKQIKEQGQRILKENEMKRMSKTKKEKKDYRNRGRMSDQEINRKLDRLRAKDLLSQNADKASKKYIDTGKRIAQSATSLGVTYATNGSITTSDIIDSLTNPKTKASKDVISKTIGNIDASQVVNKGKRKIKNLSPNNIKIKNEVRKDLKSDITQEFLRKRGLKNKYTK